MSERTSHGPGMPCWVELSGTPDFDAAEAFYRALFGWEIPAQPNLSSRAATGAPSWVAATMLTDPQGAMFAVLAPTDDTRENAA